MVNKFDFFLIFFFSYIFKDKVQEIFFIIERLFLEIFPSNKQQNLRLLYFLAKCIDFKIFVELYLYQTILMGVLSCNYLIREDFEFYFPIRKHLYCFINYFSINYVCIREYECMYLIFIIYF